ncbi:MAG: DUF721 domain-containing protein, partial [Planctomycetes bacterium]|nr:DUF721 domain-containing protein [Planctomycetota bacterium]
LAEAWDEVVPEEVRQHTALEGFCRGTLTVMVDSASHRFKLEMLLRGGLQRALAERFSDSLNRIKLVPGRFYSVDLEGQPRYVF